MRSGQPERNLKPVFKPNIVEFTTKYPTRNREKRIIREEMLINDLSRRSAAVAKRKLSNESNKS